jgi:hypothetical protein
MVNFKKVNLKKCRPEILYSSRLLEVDYFSQLMASYETFIFMNFHSDIILNFSFLGDVILWNAAAEVHLLPGASDGRDSKLVDVGARHSLPVTKQSPVSDAKRDSLFHSHLRKYVGCLVGAVTFSTTTFIMSTVCIITFIILAFITMTQITMIFSIMPLIISSFCTTLGVTA